jgi:hypothetical protein
MRRSAVVLLGALALLAGLVAPATATAAAGCVTSADATYRHSFDGAAGVATVSAVRPLCAGQSQTFSLVTYTTQSSSFGYPQFIYDATRATITSGRSSAGLSVAVPGCYFQVDLIFGAAVYDEVVNAGSNYGNLKLGAPYGTGSRSSGPYGGDADGSSPCAPKPVITYRNACDGTFTASLSNDVSANVDAVFLVAGRRVRVAPGRSADTRGQSGTLTIRDNTFTTHIGTWERPSTGCGSPAPASSLPAPVAPAPPPPGSEFPSPEAASASPEELYTGPPAIPAVPSAPAAAAPAGPANSISWLVTALGILLIGGGVLLLIRVLRMSRRP